MEDQAMPSDLGPIEIVCDAPPYSIIQACARIGVGSPEDVRWCRMSHYLDERGAFGDFLTAQPWKSFLGTRGNRTQCFCGKRLPALEKCTFTFITGREVSYFIGQCRRCRTVFWDDA